MSLPVLYGTAGSRAFRSIWAAEEINLAYEHVPTSFRGDNQAEAYLRINPNGRIPALVDGDLCWRQLHNVATAEFVQYTDRVG
ncbi:MAG: glutathione S-transferase [Rhodospirillaceae bacterium]|nr:glutathione S-transferase [Rhodospirillaceae bacterium]